MDNVIDVNNGRKLAPRDGRGIGLTDKQKEYASEIFARISQGIATGLDAKSLMDMQEYDSFGFINAMLASGMSHKSFSGDDGQDFANNIAKYGLLYLKMEDSKNRAKVSESQSKNIDIRTINKMLKMNKPEDGKKFGLGGTDVVIDSDSGDTNFDYESNVPNPIIISENVNNSNKDIDISVDSLSVYDVPKKDNRSIDIIDN